jgi:hypothetical protein
MSVKDAVLAFIDAIMEFTVPAHEKLCDENKCTIEDPCPYCRVNDKMMEEVKKLK